MSDWYKDRRQFPGRVDRTHPLYDALEFYHEDDGTVVPHGMLVECDLDSGYIKYKSGEQGSGYRKQDVYTSTRGPWRCRWRPDKVVRVEDRPVEHYGYMTGGL